ncbi:MAG: hypothetical protein HY561_02510 [Gemmatimonadetes bacterium]|nr:hypothetical protein [Gemmatimonadota bacterium]
MARALRVEKRARSGAAVVRNESHPDPHAAARRRILRRATLYTYGFLGAALALALAGGALLAWLLRPAGVAFVTAWLGVTGLILLVPVLAAIVRLWRWRRQRSPSTGSGADGE